MPNNATLPPYPLPMLLVVVALFLVSASRLDAQIWQWGVSGGSQSTDSVARIATDLDGKSVIVGTYRTVADFGAIRVDNNISSSALFVVLYNSSGTPQWGVSNGGSGTITAGGVAYDRSGNVLVTGSFQGTVSFGPTVLATAGASDVFLVKISPNGVVLWARRGGGTEPDVATDIAVDSLDNAWIVGSFGGTARFDTSEIVSSGENDIFLAKYDPTGAELLARSDGGLGDDRASCIGLDGTGNISIAGYFSGTTRIGGDTMTSSGSTDLFVARYTSKAVSMWGRRGGGVGADAGSGIAVDKFGSAWVAGSFSDTARFSATGLRSHGGRDLLVVRYDGAGTVRWSFGGGGAGDDEAGDVVVDEAGSTYTIGTFIDSASFGLNGFVDLGNGDMVTLKLNSSGELQWVQTAGGATETSGRSIGIDRFNELYTTGRFRGTARFGSVLVPTGNNLDIYVAKFGADASIAVGSVAAGPYCPGAQISIPYTVTGTFQPGNIFSAEISDSEGSFANPKVIGTRVSTTTGTLVASVPISTPAGKRYRLRLTGTRPIRIGTPNGDDIEIVANPVPTVTPLGPISLCAGDWTTLDAGVGYIFYQWSTGATSRTISVSTEGSYTVTVGNAAGCTGTSAPTVVTVNVPVVPPTIKKLTSNLLESSVSFQYQWYRNGDTIPGAVNRTYLASLTGLYQVRITLENGCSAISDPLELQLASVEDVAFRESITLVPNPAVNDLTITIPAEPGDPIKLRVVDVVGRSLVDLLDIAVDGTGVWRHRLNTEGWNPGVYFILIDRKGVHAVMGMTKLREE